MELKFFGGLSLDETAEALGLSVATVEREWQAARAWLLKSIGTVMTPERWQKITDLFHASLESDAAGRDAFLDRAVPAIEELRAEVEAMLKAHESAGNAMALLDQPCAGDETLRREIEALLVQGTTGDRVDALRRRSALTVPRP